MQRQTIIHNVYPLLLEASKVSNILPPDLSISNRPVSWPLEVLLSLPCSTRMHWSRESGSVSTRLPDRNVNVWKCEYVLLICMMITLYLGYPSSLLSSWSSDLNGEELSFYQRTRGVDLVSYRLEPRIIWRGATLLLYWVGGGVVLKFWHTGHLKISSEVNLRLEGRRRHPPWSKRHQ